MQKAFDLIKTAGFETLTLTRVDNNTSIPKYAVKIKEPDFKIVQALPFRRWHRVPGMPEPVDGLVPPPSDVEPYTSCDASLGTNSLNHKANLIIKNPLNRGDNLVIKLLNGPQTAICKIVDMHGKVMDQFNITDNINSYALKAHLSVGLYFIQVFFPGQIQNKKLIIN